MGCAPADPARDGPIPLVSSFAWEPAAGVDPLADRVDADPCGMLGVVPESGTVEIDTGLCPYAWLDQPVVDPVPQGAPIEVVAWHQDLASLDLDAEGHLALMINGEVFWERIIPIPSPACAFSDVVDLPVDAEIDDRVQLHLHNHGANTWNVLRVARVAADTPRSFGEGCAE